MKNEKNEFLIKEAAEKCGVTSETLRHYDRIDLVKPSRKENGYRYYSNEQLLIISIIKRIQSIGFSLEEVKKLLSLDNLLEVKRNLENAVERCDEKISELKETKKIIRRAILQYSLQSKESIENEAEVTFLPERYILLSNNLKNVNIESLFNYQSHYKKELGDSYFNFHFKDQAGMYFKGENGRLFIECDKPSDTFENIVKLPSGKYLSILFNEKDKDNMIKQALNFVERKYGIIPEEILALIKVTGIAKWKYLIQIKID